ncbi:SixA phosphatase family protein [Demequina sp. SO4-13]|uniref:SixA phosphatase family protein n=1 Tax=Demequina sp. SO4-13 TaxID=3401027 RepID=UPI003AF8CBC1
MPTLIIARHAKAEAPAPGLQDMDRTLALIGRKASTKLGEEISAAGITPELALVSPATRTQQTWKLMSGALPKCESRSVDGLYETDTDGLVEIVRSIEGVDTAILVGHEPTSSAACAFLAGHGSDTTALKRIAHGLPTGTAAVLEFDGTWAELGSRKARLTVVLSGRDV